MFLTKYINTIKAEPLTFLMGAGVLMLAVMGTSVRHVSSAVFAILVLMSFVLIKDWFKVFTSLSRLEKLFLAAFFLYTLSGLLSFYNVDDVDKYYKLLERFLRFSLVVPVYLLIISNGKSLLNYLYAGSIISGPFLVAIAIYHYIEHPDVPAQGYYHHIIFGQLAMLNVGIMLSLLLSRNMQRKYQLLIIASMLCGIVTAVMSQARGVWLVFPAYVLIATYYVVKDKRLNARTLVSILISVVLLALLTPVGELIKNRTDAAVTEISRFYSEDQYVSSVGTRLAMWDIAINVWQENPLLGTGPGDFDDEIQTLQKRGEYVGMAVHNSVHNIYIQALVGSGIVGLIAMLLAVIVMPTIVLLNRHVTDREGRLAGIIIIVSFAIYGFSESWTLRLSAISIFLVFLVVIVSHLSIVRSQKKQ
jgi:O-antigen ligase